MKVKYRLIISLLILCVITLMFFIGSISVEGRRALQSHSYASYPTNISGSSTSSGSYNINWGSAMPGASGVMDIDAHPYFDILCAIEGIGTRIVYYTESSHEWKVFCELPDYIHKAERIACVPIDNSINPPKPWITPFVVSTGGYVYEMTSCNIGGYSTWKKHNILVEDIAVGKYRGHIFAISQNCKTLYQYDDSTKLWQKIYSFAGEDWYPGSSIKWGYPVRLDVDHFTGDPWILTSKGHVFKWTSHPWKWWYRGRAFTNYIGDIGVGGRGPTPTEANIFTVGGDFYTPYGYSIFRHDIGKKWYSISSGLLRHITVDCNGEPWGINSRGEVFHGIQNQDFVISGAYLVMKLTKIKYKDNYESGKYSEQRVKCFNWGIQVFFLRKDSVKDGQTVNYNKILTKNVYTEPGDSFREFRIECHETDGFWGKQYYSPFIYSVNIKERCDTTKWMVFGEDSDIRIELEYEVRTTPIT